jgi:hypothetical protein
MIPIIENQINELGSRQRGGISILKGRQQMDRWLEYDLVALAMLVFGIAAVEFLALGFWTIVEVGDRALPQAAALAPSKGRLIPLH